MAGTGLSQEGDGDQSLSGERGSWASIRGEGARAGLWRVEWPWVAVGLVCWRKHGSVGAAAAERTSAGAGQRPGDVPEDL